MENGKEEWIEVNVQKLAQCLANEKWEEDTKGIPDIEKYNLGTVVDPHTGQTEIVKEVSDHWSSQYWLLTEQYKLLILQFTKPVVAYDNPTTEAADRPKGTGQ